MNAEEITKMVSDGFETAKRGEALRVYDQVLPIYEAGHLPPKSHYAFGWIIYYALRQSPSSEIGSRKRMLANYLKLQTPRPHKQHSMILGEAIRLYKDAQNAAFNHKGDNPPHFSILRFVTLWNLDHLRPTDYNRKEHEGKTLSSTVEKFLTVAIDEAEEVRQIPDEKIVAALDATITKYPDSFNLLAQRAAIHILSSENEQAASLLRKALLLAPGKFFLWSKLASLYPEAENIRLRVALLYKALRAPGPEQFKGRVRLSLAEAFMSKDLFGYALFELHRIKAIYEANGWHLPKNAEKLLAKIPAEITPQDPSAIYRKVEHLADEEIISDLPERVMAKTFHKDADPTKGGRYGKAAVAWRVTDEQGHNLWLTPSKFNIPDNLEHGTRLRVRHIGNKVVSASLAISN